MSILNPLRHVFETKTFIHSRAYRTTFWGKFWDTLEVFLGNSLPEMYWDDNSFEKHKGIKNFNSTHFGVYDYLTLGIPFILNIVLTLLMLKLDPSDNRPLFISLVVSYLILNLPRIIFSGVMTLLSLPFVHIAHALTKEKGEAVKQAILSYKLSDEMTPFYAYPSSLQVNIENYKNSYVFIMDKKELHFIDENGHSYNLTINNINQFSERLGINVNSMQIHNRNSPYSRLVCKQEMDRLLKSSECTQWSYGTLGQTLKNRNAHIESGMASTIKLHHNFAEVRLEGSGSGRSLTGFILSWDKPGDVTFFNNMRRLNIAKIEQVIEEGALQSQLPQIN